VVTIAVACALIGAPTTHAARATDLSGHWTIDHAQSQFPADIGFDPAIDAPDTPAGASGGGRGGGRGGGGLALSAKPETEQNIKIIADLVSEAKDPWPAFDVTQTDTVVTIAAPGGLSRQFHPGGSKPDEQHLASGGIDSRAKWDRTTLLIDYVVDKNRVVRYAYSRDTGTLTVAVSFLDHGRGDAMTRIYR
jgi:hypothetical protein